MMGDAKEPGEARAGRRVGQEGSPEEGIRAEELHQAKRVLVWTCHPKTSVGCGLGRGHK